MLYNIIDELEAMSLKDWRLIKFDDSDIKSKFGHILNQKLIDANKKIYEMYNLMLSNSLIWNQKKNSYFGHTSSIVVEGKIISLSFGSNSFEMITVDKITKNLKKLECKKFSNGEVEINILESKYKKSSKSQNDEINEVWTYMICNDNASIKCYLKKENSYIKTGSQFRRFDSSTDIIYATLSSFMKMTSREFEKIKYSRTDKSKIHDFDDKKNYWVEISEDDYYKNAKSSKIDIKKLNKIKKI